MEDQSNIRDSNSIGLDFLVRRNLQRSEFMLLPLCRPPLSKQKGINSSNIKNARELTF